MEAYLVQWLTLQELELETQAQILYRAISCHANALKKDQNSSVLPPAMGTFAWVKQPA